MQYDITNEFTQINETQGILQNMAVHPIRLVVSAEKPKENTSGLIIFGSEKFTFKAPDGKQVYLRTIHQNTTACVIIEDCVNFKQPASGGGAGIDDTVTATDKTWSSTKISTMIGGSSGSTGYAQITKLSVIAPKQINIITNHTDTFNLPPVEVLKFVPGLQDQVRTICAFDNTDAKDFIITDAILFDGAMHFKTSFDIAMSAPEALADGFVSESAEIDFADYKKVEAVG